MAVSCNPYKVDEHTFPPSLSVLRSLPAMRIYYLLFVLPFLFLMPVPGKMGREVSGLKQLQRGQSLPILQGTLDQGDLLYGNRRHHFFFLLRIIRDFEAVFSVFSDPLLRDYIAHKDHSSMERWFYLFMRHKENDTKTFNTNRKD